MPDVPHPFHGRVSGRIRERLSPNRSCSRPGSASSDTYLTYADISLSNEDVNTVRDDWLTDNIIAFYEEWLEHEILVNHPRVKVILLRPSMAFMLMQTPDPSTIREALPQMSRATHIFLPINDATDVERAEGGSHWSLLLVSINDGLAFHYDSMHGHNEVEGKKAADKLSQLMSLENRLRFVSLEHTPQQSNHSDCGVFVCLLMKHLLVEKLLKNHHGQRVDMSVESRQVNAAQGRRQLMELIEDKKKDDMRSKSATLSPGDATRSRSPARHESEERAGKGSDRLCGQ